MEISVVIPTYNAAEFIEKAVESALKFDFVKEVIIVEDASTDNTLEKCKILNTNHTRVKLFQHTDRKNHGDSATRNLGIEKAQYEYIAFLDADDYYLPNRFDAELELFKDPNIDGVFGAIGTDFVTENGKKQYIEKFGESFLCTVNFPAEGRDIFYNMIQEPCPFGSSFSMIALTVKKTALENPKIRMQDHLTIAQDKEFIIRLAYHSYLKTGSIKDPVAMRTAHDSNSITKIKNHSIKYYQNNTLLYKSLFDWAKNQKEMPNDSKNFFKLKFLSSKIAAQSGFAKYMSFIYYIITNPKLLKTRYRYYALRENPNY